MTTDRRDRRRRLGHRAGAGRGDRRREPCSGRASPRWSRRSTAAHENAVFPPGRRARRRRSAPPAIWPSSADCDALLVVTPAQHMRAVLAEPAARPASRWCSAPRASRPATGKLMHEVAREAQPGSPIAVLSGPDLRARGRRRPADRGDAGGRGSRRSASALARTARPARASAPTSPTTWSAPRSAARSRTCSRSPAAWSRGAGSARMPAPR